MNFACIRDCSVCPFYGHDVSARVYQNIEKSILPPGLNNALEIVKEPEQINEPEPQIQSENLPVVSEVQFTIEDIEPQKKSFFNRRKR